MYRCFIKNGNTDHIPEWKSKGLPEEIIKAPDKTLAPELIYSAKKIKVKFNGSCLNKIKSHLIMEK